MNELESLAPKVTVFFKSSSQKGGAEGYELSVREGCDQAEADRVFDIALKLRYRAIAALAPTPSIESLLEASIEAEREKKEPKDLNEIIDKTIAQIST